MFVVGKATAWSQRVDAHYRKLLKNLRLEGLWNWHTVARALIASGICIHSGTIPVERLCASSLATFAAAAKSMSKAWWGLLAKLDFLRYNYRHFNHTHLPTRSEGDAVLTERIEALLDLAKGWESECGVDAFLRNSFQPFGESTAAEGCSEEEQLVAPEYDSEDEPLLSAP